MHHNGGGLFRMTFRTSSPPQIKLHEALLVHLSHKVLMKSNDACVFIVIKCETVQAKYFRKGKKHKMHWNLLCFSFSANLWYRPAGLGSAALGQCWEVLGSVCMNLACSSHELSFPATVQKHGC
ncbi:hypothetical protein GOODEAATRI_000232 [Goodea atripinnis]|uniref:Uncharacterized protein n=1 Tax=Goodea atripinnis TaxID=208336 RepID=A0ABV0N6N5_9TELE